MLVLDTFQPDISHTNLNEFLEEEKKLQKFLHILCSIPKSNMKFADLVFTFNYENLKWLMEW